MAWWAAFGAFLDESVPPDSGKSFERSSDPDHSIDGTTVKC